jgi:hypothetical protein
MAEFFKFSIAEWEVERALRPEHHAHHCPTCTDDYYHVQGECREGHILECGICAAGLPHK